MPGTPICETASPKEEDYQWPLYSTGPEKHLHALAIVSINYNIFEYRLAALLAYYATKEVSDFLFDRMNNQERLDAIRYFASNKEKNRELLDVIDHLISYFNSCTDNRNILMHSRHSGGEHPIDVLPLEKNAADDPARLLYFKLLLPELRRVADQIRNGVTFLEDTLEYIYSRDVLRTGLYAPRPLPKKPSSPRTLNPSQPSEIPEAELPPPASSA